MKLLSRAIALIPPFFVLFALPLLTVRASDSCINLNTAPKERLEEITHIGEKRAEQIVGLRPFLSLEDLDRVPGIGPSRISDIKNQGLACASANPAPETPSRLPQPPIQPNSPPKTEEASSPSEESSLKEGLAEIKPEGKPESLSPLWPALIIAIFSGFAILLLSFFVEKAKGKKNEYSSPAKK